MLGEGGGDRERMGVQGTWPGDELSSILPTSIGSADGSSEAKRLAEVAA